MLGGERVPPPSFWLGRVECVERAGSRLCFSAHACPGHARVIVTTLNIGEGGGGESEKEEGERKETARIARGTGSAGWIGEVA